MSVHYKFKSALDFDTITFDGLHISVADLKKAIIHQKRLGKTMDFDLQITNAQTKEEYCDDGTLIPKNTSLTIARVPLKNAPKKNWEPRVQDNREPTGPPPRKGHDSSAGVQANVDLSTMNGSEEDKIREMMFQSTAEYDPTNYQRIRGQSQIGEVPLNYKCFRCHKPGHWIKNCPLGPLPKEASELKRTSGIPRSFIERDKDPENNPIMQLPPQAPPEEKQVIPEDLICAICKDLFTDAVMIPCCGSSFCDECVRTALLESEDNECPDCKEKGSSPGSLIPNRFLRNSVNAFRNETGYTKAPQKSNNKQTKPAEEPPAAELAAVSSSTNVGLEASNSDSVDADKDGLNPDEEHHHESTEHCDLHESYEEVSQHGDIGSPNGDDKVFDNESDYEDNITVTVPPAHLQSRGAFRGHYNGRSARHPRLDTPPIGREHSRDQYSGTSSSGGSRGERNEPSSHHDVDGGGSRTPQEGGEHKESSYNPVPPRGGDSKHEYDSRHSPDYHQQSSRGGGSGLIPLPPTHSHPPQHQPMPGGLPPHAGYMGPAAHQQGPAGPYPGPPHGAPHPYPGSYGMQPGYPPQRPYDHPVGMYHGERPPRMMYPPRGGYPPHHPPHMRPRHMAPMGGPTGYPGVPHVTGVIDDPLEAFNRIMREKERRKEQEQAKQAANRHRSPHADRGRRSRSFDNSGGGGGNRGGRGRSSERERRRSPRARSPDRRRSPDDKHADERDRDRGDRGRDRERERGGGGGRRRNRSSSYSSSGSRSYSRSKSRSPAKRGGAKSPKRRSRSPYRERRSRSRSKSFEDRRHGKHSKDRRDDRRDEHRSDYRDNRDRSPGYGSHYSSYRGRGSGSYRGSGLRGRGGSRGYGGPGGSGGYGDSRGHILPQGPPVASQHDQYGGHPMGPGPVDYHGHHDPTAAAAIGQHHHMGGVPPTGHYAGAPSQQAIPPGGAAPSRYAPRDVGRGPYMHGGHPMKAESMGGYYDVQPVPHQVTAQQSAPTEVSSVEPPPPGFDEQDNWSGKQEADYRNPTATATVPPGKTADEASYEYHNTPKRGDHERAHTPVIRSDDHRHEHHMTRSRSKDKDTGGKKKSRGGGGGDDGDDQHHRGGRDDRRTARSKTPDRHEKDGKSSKRATEHERDKDKDKKRGGGGGDSGKDKRGVAEKERHRDAAEKEREREKESKRRQRDSSEEEKKEKKKEKEKKKRKKEKEAEKKKHKKERKEKDKEARSKERKKDRKTVEKEEADSSLQPATPKHAPGRAIEEYEKLGGQQEVDTTQEYGGLEDTLVIPVSHDVSKTTSEGGEELSYREEPSSSHDQSEQQQEQLVDTSDLYSDIPDKYEGDQLEKSILEGHDEDLDLVNSSGVGVDDPLLQEEIKRSDSILDLHANLDFEADLEEGEHQSPPKSGMFIGIPELSKWELDEEALVISSSERKNSGGGEDHDVSASGLKQDHEAGSKVTNEVLKRAENAIFTRAINAIRPIEIKKISVDRQKLYSNESMLEDGSNALDMKGDKQQDELKRFQVTVPVNDDHAERSVEIKPADGGKQESRASPSIRGSIKERLGSKVSDVRRGSSSSNLSRSRTPPPASAARKVKSSSGGGVTSTLLGKLVDLSSSSSLPRKRTRSRSQERGGKSAREDSRRREEIRISSSSSSRRQESGGGSSSRRVVVMEPSAADKRREADGRKDRGGRSKEQPAKDARAGGGRRSSRERSRERQRDGSSSANRRGDKEKEREKERGGRDRKEGAAGNDDRGRRDESRSGQKQQSLDKSSDKKSHDRKRSDMESTERRHRNASPVDKDRRGGEVKSSSSKDEPRRRGLEGFEKLAALVDPKKSKSDKPSKSSKAAGGKASSTDSSSSDSDSSSSSSSSDSDEEAARKRKKRKHKKERKRSKRSGSTESDDSGGKKKKKSKKSKSAKKKKKEKKHRKGE